MNPRDQGPYTRISTGGHGRSYHAHGDLTVHKRIHHSPAGYVIVTIAVVVGAVVALIRLSGDVPGPAPTPGPAGESIAGTSRSAQEAGLTMTVSRIENSATAGRVHLRLDNHTGLALILRDSDFLLTDRSGQTYQAVPSGAPPAPAMWSGAAQVRTIDLDQRIRPGSGPLRAEFLTVYGHWSLKSIAVTGIPAA